MTMALPYRQRAMVKMVVVVVRAVVTVVNMFVAEVLYISVYLVVRMEEVVIFL